jgi:hypothetical protein
MIISNTDYLEECQSLSPKIFHPVNRFSSTNPKPTSNSNFYRQVTKFAKKDKTYQEFLVFRLTFPSCSWRPWRLGGEIGFVRDSKAITEAGFEPKIS